MRNFVYYRGAVAHAPTMSEHTKTGRDGEHKLRTAQEDAYIATEVDKVNPFIPEEYLELDFGNLDDGDNDDDDDDDDINVASTVGATLWTHGFPAGTLGRIRVRFDGLAK
jgi:hypothetical protein